MSSAGRGGPREPEDYYTTPSWAVRRLLEVWRPERTGPWVEPSAGNGAIIRVVDASPGNRPAIWRAFEIREEERAELTRLCGAGARIENFLAIGDAPDPDVAAVLGNPPYTFAFEFLRQAHYLYPNAEIVFLLRQAFTASQERYGFMRSHVPDKFELPDRPSFTDGGGDSADYAWMRWPAAWERTVGEIRLLRQTPLAERKLDRGHEVVIENPQLMLL